MAIKHTLHFDRQAEPFQQLARITKLKSSVCDMALEWSHKRRSQRGASSPHRRASDGDARGILSFI